MAAGRFDALFIDFYGTVTGGDRRAVEDASRCVVEDFDLAMTADEFAVAWGRIFFAAADNPNHGRFRTLFEIECESLVDTLETLGVRGTDPLPYVRRLKDYWADPVLQPDAAEALASLQVPVCCVSNADTEDILAAIERHGLRFERVITSEDTRCYKPAPAIFEHALTAMGRSPARVVHAGDSLHADVNGAARLGIATVWVCRDGRIFDVGDARPDYKVNSLDDLGDIISGKRSPGLPGR